MTVSFSYVFAVASATPPVTVMDAINIPRQTKSERTTQSRAHQLTLETLRDRTTSAVRIFCAGDMTLLRHDPAVRSELELVLRLLDVENLVTPLLGTWQFWALMSATFAALTAIFAKIGVETINSDLATLIRTVVVLCALAAIVTATGQWQPLAAITSRTYFFLALSGLATGASWLCYFRALKLGQAAQVAPIDKLSVVLVAIFGALFLGERLTSANWLGVLLIAIGAVFVSFRPA